MAVDMSTKYLGLRFANPILVSACPLTGELDVLRKLEQYGAAGAVLPSLFEEQLVPPTASDEEHPLVEELAHFHSLKEYNRGPDAYLKHVAAAKKAVSFPIIASLNVTGPSDATRDAHRIQEAVPMRWN